jgi:hypothetical protein
MEKKMSLTAVQCLLLPYTTQGYIGSPCGITIEISYTVDLERLPNKGEGRRLRRTVLYVIYALCWPSIILFSNSSNFLFRVDMLCSVGWSRRVSRTMHKKEDDPRKVETPLRAMVTSKAEDSRKSDGIRSTVCFLFTSYMRASPNCQSRLLIIR